jgi:hypothetical protein
MPRGGRREGAGRPKGATDKKARSAPIITASVEQKRELRAAAREHTGAALEALVRVCKMGDSESARVAAANALLDRGYGKPLQQIEAGTPGDFSHLSDAELDEMILENMALIEECKRSGH